MFLIIYLERLSSKHISYGFYIKFQYGKDESLQKKVLWICPIPKSSCMIFLKRLTASQKRITFCMCTSEYYEFSFCWNEKKARTISYICLLLNKNANIKLFCARSLELSLKFYADLHPLFVFSF